MPSLQFVGTHCGTAHRHIIRPNLHSHLTYNRPWFAVPPRKPPDLVSHVSISFDFDKHVANDNDPVSFESPHNTNDNVNDQPTYQVNTTTYSVSKRSTHPTNRGALIDRGANGGLAGADVRITGTVPHGFVNVEGIDNHQLPNIPIVTAVGVVTT